MYIIIDGIQVIKQALTGLLDCASLVVQNSPLLPQARPGKWLVGGSLCEFHRTGTFRYEVGQDQRHSDKTDIFSLKMFFFFFNGDDAMMNILIVLVMIL